MVRILSYLYRICLSLFLFSCLQNCGATLLLDNFLFNSSQKDGPTQIADLILATMNVGLIHYWPLDGDANDKVGSMHLTAVGSPVLTSDHNGLPNGAYKYNGINDAHDSGVAGDLALTGNVSSFTVSAWVKGKFPQAGGGSEGIFLAQGDGLGLQFYVNAPTCFDRIRAYTTQGGSGAVDLSSSCGVYRDDVWYHVTFIWDMPANTGYLYVNNDLIYGATFSASQVPWTSTGSFTLGFGTLNGYHHNGSIDEVRVYDRIVHPILFAF